MPLVEVSVGELVDKLTILELKRDNIEDATAQEHVRQELAALSECYEEVRTSAIDRVQADLRKVNKSLWDIEDRLRKHEREKRFDSSFIDLARSVYTTNDRRAALKRAINEHSNSRLVEVKSYTRYE